MAESYSSRIHIHITVNSMSFFFFSLLFCRLCSVSITRLTLMMPLPPDLTSLSLAVKMQSSKRTLRSHEIPVPQTFLTGSNSVGFGSTTGSAPPSLAACNLNNTSFGSIGGSASSFFETDLDLHFSLQYPHFIKRDGNRFVTIFYMCYIFDSCSLTIPSMPIDANLSHTYKC